MMRDESSLRRQWLLLKALSSQRLGLKVREMAAELGVTDKTICRDLDLFRGLGFPLEERIGEFGRKTWRIVGARDQPPLSFSYDEAIALYLGRRMLDLIAGTPFWEAARNAFAKIRAMLGAGALEYIDRFSGLFHRTGVGQHDDASQAELIGDLMAAMEDGKQALLRYRSEGVAEATDRVVHPFGLFDHRGALYLVALDPRDGTLKHYKVGRIEAAEVIGAEVRRPEGFELGAYMASAFGAYRRDGEPTAITIRFGASASRYVRESRWHDSHRLTPMPDGGVLAEYRVSGTEEIKRWILGFGAKAVVVAPESLRCEIIRELEDLAAAYAIPEDVSAPRPSWTGSPHTDRRPRPNRRPTNQGK